MHDSSVLVFDFPPYHIRRKLPGPYWRNFNLDVWHVEPGGADAGKVCGYPSGNSELNLRSLRWAIQHRHHLYYRFWPWLHIKRWIVDRCDECDQRFRWMESRIGYMSMDIVLHDKCHALRHVRGQLNDLTLYVQGNADDTTRWRATYRLDKLAKDGDPDSVRAVGDE